ncbi:MAG: class I SAM-dependent methyltransferase [Pseudonocardia sp.]
MTADVLGPTEVSVFSMALAGQHAELVRSDGGVAPLDVARWRGAAAGEDSWLLGRCRGATIDLGCGPGRLLEALVARGVPALGVDVAAEAIAQCRRRGVRAMRADVFTTLPGEGTWAHVLLADGNLGIGGDPVALLRRAAALISPNGTVLVELDATEPGLWRGLARVRSRHDVGTPFPWAAAGAAALPGLAGRAGLRPSLLYRGRRSFAELVPAAPKEGDGRGPRDARPGVTEPRRG